MKLKINKACDLSSISVLPPQSRRANAIVSGPDSSIFGKSQASQLRSQPQQSQQSFSQGMSSQLSQSSLDDILTNEQRFGSQEKDNSVKRISCLAPVTYTQEDPQMLMSISSTNHMRRWNSVPPPEHRCHVSEELEHRISLMETSLNRFGMILDSIQSDVMQVNKTIKEVSIETEGINKKLVVQDGLLQLMLKGEEELKASLDASLISIPDQVRKDLHQYKLEEIVTTLLALPAQIEARLLKMQTELCRVFIKKIEAINPNQKDLKPTLLPQAIKHNQNDLELTLLPRRRSVCLQSQKVLPTTKSPVVLTKAHMQRAPVLKIKPEGQGWLKPKSSSFTQRQHKQEEIAFTEQDRERRIIIELDDDSDGGFSCLLGEKEGGLGRNLSEEAIGETERILRKARKRRRKHCNTCNYTLKGPMQVDGAF